MHCLLCQDKFNTSSNLKKFLVFDYGPSDFCSFGCYYSYLYHNLNESIKSSFDEYIEYCCRTLNIRGIIYQKDYKWSDLYLNTKKISSIKKKRKLGTNDDAHNNNENLFIKQKFNFKIQ